MHRYKFRNFVYNSYRKQELLERHPEHSRTSISFSENYTEGSNFAATCSVLGLDPFNHVYTFLIHNVNKSYLSKR